MTTLTYNFEAYTKLVNGALVFAKSGVFPVEVELDLETDGEEWEVKVIRLVETNFDRATADAFELTEDGPLLQSAKEMIAGDWNAAINYFVGAEYSPPEDERATEAWKDA